MTERAYKKTFWSIAIGFMVVAGLPFITGQVLKPAGATFYGNTVVTQADPSIYYSYIEQGRRGQIFMYDAFTSEPYAATLWQPLWWAIGLLAELLHLSTPLIFSLIRWGLAGLYIAAVWWAVKWLWTDRVKQLWGLATALFASGFGGFYALAANHLISGNLGTPPDVWVSESFSVLTAWSSPHFLLVTSGIIFILISVEKAQSEKNWRRILWASLAAIITLSIHPFHIITWLVFWLIMTIGRGIKLKTIPRSYIAKWGTVILSAGPVVLLYGLQLAFDPLAYNRAIQNDNTSSAPWLVAIGLGLPLIAAAATLFNKKWRTERWWWLILLAAAYFIALYLPISFQRRLGQGLILPLAWLAAPVFLSWMEAVKRWRPRLFKPASGALFLLLSSSWLITAGWIARDYVKELTVAPLRQYYLPAEYISLSGYLKRSTDPHQPIISSVLEGNIIAGLTAHQVFVGYGVETVDFNHKLAIMRQFYSNMNIDQQRAVMRDNKLCYILTSSRSSAYGSAFQPTEWPDLQRVWTGPTMSLYKLAACPS